MSAQTDTPLLTATDIRADTLLLLLNARFVNPDRSLGAMRVLGLVGADMSAARRRVGLSVAVPPVPVEDEPAEPETITRRSTYVAPPKARLSKAPTNSRPVNEGKLRCSKCQEWKPEDQFGLRTDRLGSGTRRSACRDCHRKDGRQRYLNVKALDSLTLLGLDFVVEEGDSSAKFVCGRCGKPIEPGDDATLIGAVEHSTCVKGEDA